MADLHNQKWDLSKEEQYAIKWFEEHGFSVKLDKQYISKTKFTVCKDGTEDQFELMQGIKGMVMPDYMAKYGKNFEMLVELQRLREEAKCGG